MRKIYNRPIENRFISIRLIDGKPRKVIVDKEGKIVNRDPSKEELKVLKEEPYRIQKYTKKQLLEFLHQFYKENERLPKEEDFSNDPKYPNHTRYFNIFGSWNNAIRESGLWGKCYNKTKTCDRCGKNFEEIKGWGHPRREYDIIGNWTGRWDCLECWGKYDPNSQNNIIKSMRDSRTGNLDPNSTRGKGNLGEELTNRWRGIKNLNKENDNYNSPIDHSRDTELGIIQTKIAWYDPKHRCWSQHFRSEHNKDFNFLILHCVSEDGEAIERTYIIPEKEVKSITNIGVYKYRTSGSLYENGWYEEYRLRCEKEKKKINDIWKEILEEEVLKKEGRNKK